MNIFFDAKARKTNAKRVKKLNEKTFFYEASDILPGRIRAAVRLAGEKIGGAIYEIRLYAASAAVLTTDKGAVYVTDCGGISGEPERALRPTANEIREAVIKAAGWSPFAHAEEIKNGYITFGRGIRAGFGTLCGGEVTVRGITSLNIRIPCAGTAPRASDAGGVNGLIRGLLIAGEPGSGKTTMLKNITVLLSQSSRRVCVIDERREFFGREGIFLPPANVDVISGCDKETGIMRALRLLSPEFIICDEIGTESESRAVKACLNSGVRFIASIHAGSLCQLVKRRQFITLFNCDAFDRVVFLSSGEPGRIVQEYTFTEVKYAILGADNDMPAGFSHGADVHCGGKKESKAVSCPV